MEEWDVGEVLPAFCTFTRRLRRRTNNMGIFLGVLGLLGIIAGGVIGFLGLLAGGTIMLVILAFKALLGKSSPTATVALVIVALLISATAILQHIGNSRRSTQILNVSNDAPMQTSLTANTLTRPTSAPSTPPTVTETADLASRESDENRSQSFTQLTSPGLVEVAHISDSVTMDFVRIPPGEFLMGCSERDDQCYDHETPVHTVRLTKGFQIGKYEVTQEQWQAVMGNNPSRFKGPTLPVIAISWIDVQQFLETLNQRGDGYHYRLPTEAEWEYAARAGSREKYAQPLDSVAWYRNNSGREHLDDEELRRLRPIWQVGGEWRLPNDYQTHPVGQKSPNAWGIHDTSGNVWEWVQDRYGNYGESAAVDPGGPELGDRTMRGGSFINESVDVRVSMRAINNAATRQVTVGFRCVREP
jgi:formylglycine-generating enzyme required for sulfatase activity